jgi:hypothetical protein
LLQERIRINKNHTEVIIVITCSFVFTDPEEEFPIQEIAYLKEVHNKKYKMSASNLNIKQCKC